MENWAPVSFLRKTSNPSEALSVRSYLMPGDIGWLIWLHGVTYAREYGWDQSFEANVAGPLADFALRNNPRERIWLVECIDRVGMAFGESDVLSQDAGIPFEHPGADLPTQPPPEAYPSIVGSVAVVESSAEIAQLRWLFLTPELRGKGIGRTLMEKAVNHCFDEGFQNVFLWTTSDLVDAAKLYIASGFQLVEEITHSTWGKMITEQKYEKTLRKNN
jgi:GNAT superfamily N-acetyltransferase